MKYEGIIGNRKRSGIIAAVGILLGIVLLIGGTFTPGIQANGPGRFQVFDRDSVVYGRTYGEWTAAWNQWADSIPSANHPLFDTADISTGQTGPVWFLGGKFCRLYSSCSTVGVVRSGDVPAGTALFVNVFDTEDSTLENPGKQINDLRAVVQGYMDPAIVGMEVDGQPIYDLKDRFRVQSPAFVFTIPDDNFFTAVGEGPFKGGSYFPGVDDGYYVMLAPLPVGHHTIHFHGANSLFGLDITYHLNVHP
jgi:hypothetical protein